MGKTSKKQQTEVTPRVTVDAPDSPQAAQSPSTSDKEARFLAALQSMMGGAELTDEAVRDAIAKMTPEQKQQLMKEAGGEDLKRDMLTKDENKQDRNLYFQEVNKSADMAGLPIDKDNDHLAKKVRRCLTRGLGGCQISGAHPTCCGRALSLA